MFPLNVKDHFCDIVGFKKSFLDLHQHVKIQNINNHAFGILLKENLTLYNDCFNGSEFLLVMHAPIGKTIMPFTIFDENSYLAVKDISITPLHLFMSNIPDIYESSKIVNEDGTQYSLKKMIATDNLYILTFKIVWMVSQSLSISEIDLAAFGTVSRDDTISMPKIQLNPCESFLMGYCFINDLSGITNIINYEQNKSMQEYIKSKRDKDSVDLDIKGEPVNRSKHRTRHDYGGRCVKYSEIYDSNSELSKTKNNGYSFDDVLINLDSVVGRMGHNICNIKLKKELLNKNCIDVQHTKISGLISFNSINNSAIKAAHSIGKNSPLHRLAQPFIGVGNSFDSELYTDARVSFINTCLSLKDLYGGNLDFKNNLWFVHTSQEYTNTFGVKSILPTLIINNEDIIGTNVTHFSSRCEYKTCDCSFTYLPYCDKQQNLPAFLIDSCDVSDLKMSEKLVNAKNKIANVCEFIIFMISFQ